MNAGHRSPRLQARIRRAVGVLGLTVLAVVTGMAASSLRFTVRVDATSSGWDVITAVGTLGATVVALLLAISAWMRNRTSGARLVSAWVAERYEPVTGEDHYRRHVTLHVANESDEPAFDAHVSVVVGALGVPLGPLSAPSPIAVLPPRRELSFDLSVPLLAHDDTWNPRAIVSFADRAGRRWVRDGDGVLRRPSRRVRWATAAQPHQERQLGTATSNNPMMVALAFLAGLRHGPRADPENFAEALAPEAPGWASVDWNELRALTEDFQPTSMVDYPAPRIARIKLSGDTALQGKTVVNDDRMRLVGPVMFLTMTYASGRGWRVFGIGGTVPPDQILFPKGSFEQPPSPPV